MEVELTDLLTIALFFMAFMALIFSTSLALISVVAVIFVLILLSKRQMAAVYPAAAFSIVSGAIVFLINCYFTSFDPATTDERIYGALLAAVRIFGLICISAAYLRTVDGDVTYELCSKFIPRSAILTAFSLLMLPRLHSSFRETWQSLVQRGVVSAGRPRLGEIWNFTLVIKTILVDAVEESWLIAESLVHRGYTVRRK